MFRDWTQTDEALNNGTLESIVTDLAGVVLNQKPSAGNSS